MDLSNLNNQFSRALEEADNVLIREKKGSPDEAPDALWMAAQQLEKDSKISKSLLLHPDLKNIVTGNDRKAIQNGKVHDNMRVMQELKVMLAVANTRFNMHLEWEATKASLPPALLKLAAEVNKTGVIDEKRISAEVFKFTDDLGWPPITIAELKKIRHESYLLDPEYDPESKTPNYYGALLDKLQIVRENLKMEEQRLAYFERMGSTRDALLTFEAEEEQNHRKGVIDFARMIAEVETRVEQTYRQLFIDGEKAEDNRKTANLAFNAASALAIAAATPAPSGDLPAPVSIEASQEYKAPEPKLVMNGSPDQCGPESKLYVDGKKFNFIIDDPKKCADLLQIIPKVGQTVKLNDMMRLRAMEDGTYHFTLSFMKTRPECLTNAEENAYKAAGRMEKIISEMTGMPLESGICKEAVFKENIIKPEVFRGMIESMLTATNQNPSMEFFAFLNAKWFLESRHANLGKSFNSTAYGLNQFMPFTWLDELTRKGRAMGDGDVLDKAIAVAKKHGYSKEQFLSSGRAITKISYTPEMRALHRQYNSDPSHAATYGALYSADLYWRLKKGFQSDKYAHPLGKGHDGVTGQMLYSCHMLGERDCTKLFKAHAVNPDQKVRGLIRDKAFKANSYMFNKCIPLRNENGKPVINPKNGKPKCIARADLTVREFYDSLGEFGQDDHGIGGFGRYKIDGDALGRNQDYSMTTFLRVDETPKYDFYTSKDHQIAVEIKGYTPQQGLPILRKLEPTQAVPKPAAVAEATRQQPVFTR